MLIEALARSFREHAGRAALQGEGQTLTYRELEALCRRRARLLRASMGQCVVALEGRSDLEMVVGVVATLLAGQVYLGLDPRQGDSWNRRVRLLAGAALWWKNGELEVTTAGRPLPPDGWSLVFTSGTTGQPVGYLRGATGALVSSRTYAARQQMGPTSRVASLTHPRFATYTSSLLGALLHGACLCPFALADHGVERLATWVADTGITHLHTVPSVLERLLLVARPEQLTSLRWIKLGGEALRGQLVALADRALPAECRLLNGLAQTEVQGNFCYHEVDRQRDACRSRVPVGRPVDGVGVRLVKGEIEVDTPHLALLRWPDQPLVRPWRTGDLGEWDQAGELVHLGRKDRVAKLRGVRLALVEVEDGLLRLGLFLQVHVEVQHNALVAWVEPREGAQPDVWRSLARESMRMEAVPDRWIEVPAWPLTGHGKTDVGRLPRPGSRSTGRAPSGELEQRLAGWVAEVLQLHEVSAVDDFFEIGGDSLSAATLTDRVSTGLGLQLSPTWLLGAPTVERMALLLQQPQMPRAWVLQSGDRPIWIVPGGSGSEEAFTYRRWAARAVPGRAVGSWHLPFDLPPSELLEWMAACLPSQPVTLVGDCLGSHLAAHLACLLAHQGRPPRLILVNPRGGRRRTRWQHWWALMRPALLEIGRLRRHPYALDALFGVVIRIGQHLLGNSRFAGYLQSGDAYRLRRDRHVRLAAELGGAPYPHLVLQRTGFFFGSDSLPD